jgi:NAD(P)H-hydrate epimerase
MKEIDRTTIDHYKVPALLLMENAAINVVTALKQEAGALFNRRVNVFCGSGNNGGDGFAIARQLRGEGAFVRIFFTGEFAGLTPESKTNYESALRYGIAMIPMRNLDDLRRNEGAVNNCDIVIDAMIGTGLKRDIDGFLAKLIVYINMMGKYTVSVDMPTGVDSDTADVRGVAIYANLTVTFGLPKIGLCIFPGLEYAGKLVVADINFPAELLSRPRKHVLVTPEIAVKMLPYRTQNANKGNFGPVVIIGGSPGMTGAVVLSARAALKAGAGIVIAAVPESLCESIKTRSDEVITAGLKETKEGNLSETAYSRIMELAEKAKVVAIGPGIGRAKETQSLVRKLVKDIKKPMVIDADGLNALADDKTCLKDIQKDVILTPHIGEMSRLTGIRIEDIIKDKIGVLKAFAGEYKVNVLLKDGRSVLIDYDGNIYVNTTGNSGMATPGSGDVLTGVVSAFMAHSMTSAQAGMASAFVHGMAGDLLLETMSEEGITANDIADNVPRAIKALKK